MNCKPGDMAMIKGGRYPHLYGRIITVHNVVTGDERGPLWTYSGHLPVPGLIVDLVEDCFLTPIRDPGDDAVDEMVQLCGNATARTA